MAETLIEESVEIPTKSKSLRAKSIQKRLETERNKSSPRGTRTRNCNKSSKNRKDQNGYTMSKYRRRAANAKERDRMKLVNEAFERLRDVVPEVPEIPESPIPSASPKKELFVGSKSTKVTTLRCAIDYIKSLQQLIEDINNGSLDPELYKAFNPSPEVDTKMTNNKGGNPNGKNKRLIKKKGQNVNRNRGNTTSTTNRKRKSKKNDFDEKCEEKDNSKGFSLSSVFSSLHNIQQQINMKQRSADEASLSVAKLKQIYSTLTTDFSSTVQATKKKTSKLMSTKISDIPTTTTSYIVVMTGNAGSVYQPLQQQQQQCHNNTAQLFANFGTPQTPQPTRQLTVPGTCVPLPLQPLVNFSPNHQFAAGIHSDLLSSSHQLLPSSIDLLCSNLEDCDSSTLDDIEQVLKDAENFDILA